MSTNVKTTAAPGLRKGCLSFTEVIGQSIANIAPTVCPALSVPLVFALSGNAVWMDYLFATIAIVLLGLSISYFAKRRQTNGALYTYIADGLGVAPGFISGSGLVLAYILTATAVMCGFADYANTLLAFVNIHVPVSIWFAFTLISAIVLTVRDVELSARVMLVCEGASVAMILLLAGVIFAKHGLDFNVLKLSGASFGGFQSGLVLAFFSYVGFESATALGTEAKNPLKNIPRAVVASAALVGTFFVVMSLAEISGFMASGENLGEATAPFVSLANANGVGIIGLLTSVCAMISFWSCFVACITAAGRVMMSMGRDGTLPKVFSSCHKEHSTPHVALVVSAVAAALPAFVLHFAKVDLMTIFGYAGTVATLGFLFSYLLIAISAPLFLYKLGEMKWYHVAVSFVSAALILIPLVGSVYPAAAYPMNLMPIIFGGWLALSLVWYLLVPARNNVAERFAKVSAMHQSIPNEKSA